MASPRVDSGYGCTITFATDDDFNTRTSATGSFEVSNISYSGITTEALPTTHMGSGDGFGTNSIGNATFIPNDIVDPGTVTVEGHFNPDFIFTTGDAQTCTVTWPSGATWAFQGFFISDSGEAPFDGVMTRTIEIKVTGPIAVTAAT